MISGIHTTKPRTQRYVDAFVNGAGGNTIHQFRDLDALPEGEIVMYGILAGSGEIYKQCEQENKTFYYMDHSYFKNAHDYPHWLRVTKNKHCQNEITHTNPDRYEKFWKRDLKPWNKQGKKILVLPPTNAIASFFNAQDWLDETLKTLKQHTDRPIDIREKPYNPQVTTDHVGATVKVDMPTNHQKPINWNDYFACVIYNSGTAVQSLTNGVPVFCDPVMCPAAPISETDFTKIEEPKYEDRVALFSNLAYNMWTMEEMSNGSAWRMINGG